MHPNVTWSATPHRDYVNTRLNVRRVALQREQATRASANPHAIIMRKHVNFPAAHMSRGLLMCLSTLAHHSVAACGRCVRIHIAFDSDSHVWPAINNEQASRVVSLDCYLLLNILECLRGFLSSCSWFRHRSSSPENRQITMLLSGYHSHTGQGKVLLANAVRFT